MDLFSVFDMNSVEASVALIGGFNEGWLSRLHEESDQSGTMVGLESCFVSVAALLFDLHLCSQACLISEFKSTSPYEIQIVSTKLTC